MKRTPPTKRNQEKQQLALEALGSESFLSINKKLLSHFGPNLTIYLGNLIDKMKYFSSKGKLEDDNSFFLIQTDQAAQTGMSEYQLRKCKNKLKVMGILQTQMRGIPPKEFYLLDIDILVKEFLINIPLVFRGIRVKKLEDSTFRNLRNNKETENKETENKEKIYISASKTSDGEIIKKPSIKETNKEYLPIVKRLSNIIQKTKNIKHPPSHLRGWTDEIRKLVEGNGIPPSRINAALDWYEKHAGEKYVPVIESGNSLRQKFSNLEGAMERGRFNGNDKSNNNRNNKYHGSDYDRFDRFEEAQNERLRKSKEEDRANAN